MDTGTAIAVFAGAAVFLGLGIFALVISIKGLASSAEPDISAHSGGQSAKVGRSGLFIFIILGILMVIVGIGLLVAGIKGVA